MKRYDILWFRGEMRELLADRSSLDNQRRAGRRRRRRTRRKGRRRRRR